MKHRSLRQPLVIIGLLALTIAIVVTVSHGQPQRPAQPAAPAISPKVAEILQGTSNYLSSLNEFTVHGEATHDVVLPSGEHLAMNHAIDVAVQRPNHMRVEFTSPNNNRVAYYNGRTVTLYTPKTNTYGVVSTPSTIAETLPWLERRYGIALPIADLLAPDPYVTLTGKVTSGRLVGASLINGVYTNQLAFRQPDVDWQLWVEDSKTPFPRRLVILDKTQKGTPQYMMTFTRWDTSPAFPANYFTFTPPAGAQIIKVMEMPQTPRQGRTAR